jgi:hypothetical protein
MLGNVYALIDPFVRLCLLNAKPQDLPASALLLRTTLGAYLLMSALTAAPVYDPASSIVAAFIDVGLLAGYAWIALQSRAHAERYVQTLSALAGCGVVVGALSLPLMHFIYQSGELGGGDALLFVQLLILVWLLAIYGHIYRHALSTGLFIGVLVSLGWIFLTSLFIQALFPLPA